MQILTEYGWPGNVRELENVIERLLVTAPNDVGDGARSADRAADAIRRRCGRNANGGDTVADDLFKRLIEQRESFWTAVYPLYMEREITKGNVRDLVRKGLEEARGNYKIVARIFNMEQSDYKRFLNFLRKHDCQVPFKEYR